MREKQLIELLQTNMIIFFKNYSKNYSLVQYSKLQRSKYLQEGYEQNDGTNISLIPKKMILKLLTLIQ